MYTYLLYVFLEWHKPHNRLVEAKFFLIPNGEEEKHIQEFLDGKTKNPRECFLIGWRDGQEEGEEEKKVFDEKKLTYDEIIRLKAALEYMGARKNTELKRYKHI